MKKLLLLPFIFWLSGCIDTTKEQQVEQDEVVVVDKNRTQLQPIESQVAYLPFVSRVDDRESISLYKTDGTEAGTALLHEVTTETIDGLEFNILKNFTIFGEYIYYDFVEEKFSVDTARISQLRTNIASGETKSSTEVEASEFNYPRVNRIVMDKALYLKTASDNGMVSLLKYSSDGEYREIKLEERDTTLSPISMVKQSDKLYMSATKDQHHKLVELNTKNDQFTIIPLDEGLRPIQLYAIGDMVYFLAKDEKSNQLWGYDTNTQSPPQAIYTFDNMSYGEDFIVDGGYVEGDNLYISIPIRDKVMLFCWDSKESGMRKLIEGADSIDEFISYENRLFFRLNKSLWQSDGTEKGTRELQDTQQNSIQAQELTVIENRLYFSNTTATEGKELWVYDGDNASLLVDINRGAGDSSPRYITKLNQGVVFQATSDGLENHLYYFRDGEVFVVW